MKNIVVEINTCLNAKQKEDLKNKIYYISNAIIKYDDSFFDGKSDHIILTCENDANEEYINEWVNEIIKYHLPVISRDKERIFWKSNVLARENPMITFDTLLKTGIAHESSNGRITIGEPLISLFDYFDHKINTFCKEKLNAAEYIYPTFIKTETLEKCGYIDNSPHSIFFIDKLAVQYDNYKNFIQNYKNNGSISNSNTITYYDKCQYCLPPTMCYHMYDQIQDSNIQSNYVMTAKGKAFRNEDKYAKDLERLWDFTIRETAFFGDYKFVKKTKDKFANFMYSFIDEIKLPAVALNAHDPFFLDETAIHKIELQETLAAKIELRAFISKNNSIAVSSFNYHDNFFIRNFNIQCSSNNKLVSGCTGVGLERLVYAFICQHGINEKYWPIKIP